MSERDYLTLDALAREAGVSLPTVRRWIADATHPLPSHQVRLGETLRGRVLVLRSEFETWVKTFPPGRGIQPERRSNPDYDARVAEAARDLRGH